MTEILISTWAALTEVLSGAWNLVETVAVWVGSVLYHLHVDAPRLEGLLVGVFLTWVLLRRDRHPLLRVLSSPLKLIVDILDLAWDQVVEVVQDIKETCVNWVLKTWSTIAGSLRNIWNSGIAKLQSLKTKLSKNKDEEKSE